MLTNIKNQILYRLEEFRFSHKILVSLVSLKLKNNKIKVYYKFKRNSSSIQDFDLNDFHLQNVKFNKKDEITIYKIQGIYNYLRKDKNIANINDFLEDLNNGL